MNVFHCCIYKTASQWVKSIFSDPRITEFSKLRVYDYERDAFFRIGPQSLNKKLFPEPLKDNTFVTPLYISYPAFKEIEKGSSYKAFFVTRDPRDIVISWYFSIKYSHAVIADYIARDREYFRSIPEKEGLKEAIHRVSRAGFFNALGSWADAPSENNNILLVKYEDLTGKASLSSFKRLFEHFEIEISEEVLRSVLEDYSFKRLTGRERGFEDENSHLRKGIEGDRVNFFDDELLEVFEEIAGDLPQRFGYKTKDELLREHVSLYYDLSVRNLENLQQAKSDLASTEAQLECVRADLRDTRDRLFRSDQECAELGQQLSEANQQLEEYKNEVQTLRLLLSQRRKKLQSVKKQLLLHRELLDDRELRLKRARDIIENMRNSKFWKLKELWMRLKTLHLKSLINI